MGNPSELIRGCAIAFAFAVLPLTATAEEVLRVPLQPVPSFLGYAPDEFVVVFKRATAHQLEALPPQGDRARANLERVQQVLDRVAARGFEREFVSAKPQTLGSRFPDLTGHYLVKLQPGMNLDEAVAAFAAQADVDHVEKIGIHTIDLTPSDRYYLNLNPPMNPPFPWKQWHYWDTYGIDADLAWNIETGSQNVAVGILDTGMRYTHSDLGGSDVPGPADNVTNGNIWVNPLDPPGGGDNEGNGFTDDVIGWDFVSGVLTGYPCRDPDCGTPDNDPMDGEGHGTHVGGTVGAITNNDNLAPADPQEKVWVAGIAGGFGDGTPTGAANGVKLIPLRIGYHTRFAGIPTGVIYPVWAAQAMNYVADLVDRGINVTAVNCSWGSSNTGGMEAAVANLQAHDVLIVSAAGNSNAEVSYYLPTVPGVLCVGATDSLGVGASFSNFGPLVDLAAPGVHVMSTYSPNQDDGLADGEYVALLDGTSMSAPHVVGVAALLESFNPGLTAQQKADLIVNHTSPFASGNSKQLGTGILNAKLALDAAPTPVGVANGPPPAARILRLRATPNPLRGGTNLVIQAPAGERVRVAILDAAGRLVRSLEATVGAGATRLRWDGLDSRGLHAGTGLYFAVARSATAKASIKLAVLD